MRRSKLKVLIVNYMETKHPGGINKVVMEIAKNLAKKGHEAIVLQPNPSNLPNEEFYEGFKIIRISSPLNKYFYGLSWGIYQYLKKNLKELNPDVIHVNGHHTLQSIEVMHTIKKIDPNFPLIFSLYYDIVTETFAGKYFSKIHNYFSKREIGKCNYIISVSQFESEYIIKKLNVDQNKLKIIPLGVDVFDYIENVENIDISKDVVSVNTAKSINDKKNINLLYAGHIVSRKGIDFILKSLNVLVYDLDVKNVSLTIVGEGPEKKKLINLSKKLKIDNYIKWESFLSRDTLIKKIKGSDIFMLLSRSEAFGITVAEALALGTPCIITDKTSLKEFSNEPGSFVVNYPPEPLEVANLILEVYQTEVTIGPFTQKIRLWKNVLEDYEKLYESIIKID